MAENLRVTYDGPAVEGGQISVDDLAPSLVALSALLRELHGEHWPFEPAIRLEIRANERGSFKVDLQIVQEFADDAINILNSDAASAAANLVELGSVLVALILIVKKLAQDDDTASEDSSDRSEDSSDPSDDSPPTDPEPLDNVEFEPSSVDEQSPTQLRALASMARGRVRRLVRQFLAPLSRSDGGMTNMSIEATNRSAQITAAELAEVDLEEGSDVLLDDTSQILLRAVSIAFEPDNKWRMSDGQARYWVKVEDPDFLARVEMNQESFRKNDLFRVQLRTIQRQEPDGRISTERFAETVEHLPTARVTQPHLEGMDDGGEPQAADPDSYSD